MTYIKQLLLLAINYMQIANWITKKLKSSEIIQKLGTWSDQELELQLPNYVNAWRLHNMSTSIDSTVADRITELEAQFV